MHNCFNIASFLYYTAGSCIFNDDLDSLLYVPLLIGYSEGSEVIRLKLCKFGNVKLKWRLRQSQNKKTQAVTLRQCPVTHDFRTPPPPLARTTPLSNQHEVLLPQLWDPWNLVVPFSGCPLTTCAHMSGSPGVQVMRTGPCMQELCS